MSPKAGQKKLPQSKPSLDMEMRRRRADEKPAAGAENHGAESHGADGANSIGGWLQRS